MHRPDYIAVHEALKYIELGMNTGEKSRELSIRGAKCWKWTKAILNVAVLALITYLIFA
jgi:hypothetical protein